MTLYPVINHLGHIWYVLARPSKLGKEYVVLSRKFWRGELSRKGYVAMTIDVKRHLVECDLCYEGNCPHSCHSKYMGR